LPILSKHVCFPELVLFHKISRK